MKRLVVLCMLVGVSLAAAATLKMKWFDWTDGIGDKDGVATLHYVEGQGVTKIHVTITGFEPDTSYIADIGNGQAGGSIVTNNGGNGEVNVSTIPGVNLTLTDQTVTIFRDCNGDGLVDANDVAVASGTAR